MNKTILLALAIAAVPVLAGAQTTKKTAKKADKPMHCAVMPSNKVNVALATKNHMYADYNGRRYFFCCGGCPQSFAKNPAKYAKADSIALPKALKKAPKKNG